eukprot:gene8732-biopygen9189
MSVFGAPPRCTQNPGNSWGALRAPMFVAWSFLLYCGAPSAEGLRVPAQPRARRTAPWLNGGHSQTRKRPEAVCGRRGFPQASGSGFLDDTRPRSNTDDMRLPRQNEIPGIFSPLGITCTNLAPIGNRAIHDPPCCRRVSARYQRCSSALHPPPPPPPLLLLLLLSCVASHSAPHVASSWCRCRNGRATILRDACSTWRQFLRGAGINSEGRTCDRARHACMQASRQRQAGRHLPQAAAGGGRRI